MNDDLMAAINTAKAAQAKSLAIEGGEEMNETAQATELLTEVPGDIADLYRQASGYSVAVIYLPDLNMKEPEQAHVTIRNADGEALDTLRLDAAQGLDAFQHPQRYSLALCEFLTGNN